MNEPAPYADLPAVFWKVCCIMSVAEARAAVSAGAHALGLVSHMPSGPGVIDEGLIAEIVASVTSAGAGVETVLLTSALDADTIAGQQRRTGASALQLVDAVPFDELQRLRGLVPGVRLIQVIHVRDAAAVDEARAVAPLVDGLLLDSGNPGAPVRTLGGTGQTHDWAVSAAVCAAVEIPVFLAGGLRTDNVAAAIAAVRPAGVDLCSGLRTDGRLDPAKLTTFGARLALRRHALFRSA
jgi:phosphoribosylanthranilate isomerase